MEQARPFVVLKFGGTSVATAERWRTILDQVQARISEQLRPVVVCSAMSGVTDLLETLVREAVEGRHAPVLAALRERHLELAGALGVDGAGLLAEDMAELDRLALAASLLREASPRLRARIVAFGEILSTRLGAAYLQKQGVAAEWLDARACLVASDDDSRPESSRVLSATVSDDTNPQLVARLSAGPSEAFVTQGFIAGDRSGGVVLLGRGGSDTSAAYFAASLSAARCEIWTDVPGIFTADPRLVPSALLVRATGYAEAQEIATMGAKVLHPRCIGPCRRHRIPLHIRWIDRPDFAGTVIEHSDSPGQSQVKAISHKRGVVLVSMETPGMWQQVGFLADIFACFKQRGMSIDLVSTSEMNVTVSLDASANPLDVATLDGLLTDLSRHCRATVVAHCAAVSLLGRHIRATLHRLGPVLTLFEEHRIHMVSQAASDLNLTFVVDEDQAERLVRSLHALLFERGRVGEPTFGPSWSELFEDEPSSFRTPAVLPWWRRRRSELLALAAQRSPVYVLDDETLCESIAALRALRSVDRVCYAIKANAHPAVLRAVAEAGLGLECVSPGEIAAVRSAAADLPAERILFTPNFAPREEYAEALSLGVRVTVDNLYVLEQWGELFAGREILLRLDPGTGRGHHEHVQTAGRRSKFGIAASEIEVASRLAAAVGVHVIGLHAHAGSGVLDATAWTSTAIFLAQAAEAFPEVTLLDVGGGMGVPERPGQGALRLDALDEALMSIRQAHPRYQLWIEPGRFVVAQAGVLLARVTQVKHKNGVTFVGVDAGMNSLIRPALYGSYHEIVNLSRLDERATVDAHVVGPICESGDVIGHSRRLPRCSERDVLLIGTAGAYGSSMSSRYNLREPAGEHFLDRGAGGT